MKAPDTARKTRKGCLRRITRLVGSLLLVLLGLIGLLAIVIQTPVFKSWLRGYLEDTIGESVNADCTIGGLSGNLFTSIELSRIVLATQNDTLVSIDNISATYSPMAILDGTIKIDQLRIIQPDIRLRKDSAGEWNVSQLVPATEDVEPESDNAAIPFDIELVDFRLEGGTLSAVGLLSDDVTSLDNLNLSMNGFYGQDNQHVALDSFSCEISNPDLVVNRIAFDVTGEHDRYTLTGFEVRTSSNRLTARADVDDLDPARAAGNIALDRLNLEEYRFALPDIIAGISPDVSIDVEVANDTLVTGFNLSCEEQSISAQLTLFPLPTAIDSLYLAHAQYRAGLTFKNIVPADWVLGLPDSSLVTGTIDVSGVGLLPETAVLNADVDLADCLAMGLPLSEVSLTGKYARGDAAAELHMISRFGRIDGIAEAMSLLTGPGLHTELSFQEIELGRLAQLDLQLSKLSGSLNADIKGLALESAHGSATLGIQPIMVESMDLDTISAEFALGDGRITLDSLRVTAAGLSLAAGGIVDSAMNVNAGFTLYIDSQLNLDSIVTGADVSVQGTVTGQLQGQMEDFRFHTEIFLDNSHFDEYSLNRLTVDANGNFTRDSLAVAGSLAARGLDIQETHGDSLIILFDQVGNRIEAHTSLHFNDSTGGSVILAANIDTNMIVVAMDSLRVMLGDHQLHSAFESRVAIGDNYYELDSLVVTSSRAGIDDPSTILASGSITPGTAQDILVRIKDLDLTPYIGSYFPELPINGRVDMEVNLEGTDQQPELSLKFVLHDAVLGELPIDSVKAHLAYAGDSVTLAGALRSEGHGTMSADVLIPIRLTVSNMEPIDPDTLSVRASVTIDSIPLELISSFAPEIEATGQIDGDFGLRNRLSSAVLFGELNLHGADISAPIYGLEWDSLTIDLSLDSNTVALDTVYVVSRGGTLSLTGGLEVGESSESEFTVSTDARLKAVNFPVAYLNKYSARFDADARISGPADSLVYAGNVVVTQSRVTLPSLLEPESQAGAGTQSLPLLVKEVESSEFTPVPGDSIEKRSNDSLRLDELYNNLRGRLTLEIPRDCWIYGPGTSLELRGSIDAVKEGPEFELFGSVEIVRGHVGLIGRRFNIDEGKVTFNGGPIDNPRLDLSATYTFRDPDRSKKNLTVTVTGTATEPKLSFAVDNVNINEGEALCYIAFNRPCELVGEAGAGGANQLASAAAAGILSQQVAGLIGNTLALDVFEVEAQKNFSAASFTIGKYLTENLFVSYARTVGTLDEEDAARDEYVVEYELLRFFLLKFTQAESTESGLDAVLKLEFE